MPVPNPYPPIHNFDKPTQRALLLQHLSRLDRSADRMLQVPSPWLAWPQAMTTVVASYALRKFAASAIKTNATHHNLICASFSNGKHVRVLHLEQGVSRTKLRAFATRRAVTCSMPARVFCL